MYRKDCFAFKETKEGYICKALQDINCTKCKFFKTKEEYNEKVKPLKYKKA